MVPLLATNKDRERRGEIACFIERHVGLSIAD